MNILSSSPQKMHESEDELYRTRLAGKLCIGLVYAAQIIPRVGLIILSYDQSTETGALLAISLAFVVLEVMKNGIEYLLFKTKGSGIVKYSMIFDIILLVFHTGDWVFNVLACFSMIQSTDPPTLTALAVYGIACFSWRTLLMTLIVQKWWLKIIPPLTAMLVASGYAIY